MPMPPGRQGVGSDAPSTDRRCSSVTSSGSIHAADIDLLSVVSQRDATRAEDAGGSPDLLARAVMAEFAGGADEVDRVTRGDAGGQKGCCAGPSRAGPPRARAVGRVIGPGDPPEAPSDPRVLLNRRQCSSM